MIKSLFSRVRRPEPHEPLWNWPLPFWLAVSYLIATLTGLLMITTWREDDLSDPDAPSLILASIIGGVVTLWVIRQNIVAAIIEAREQSGKEVESLTIAKPLNLNESYSRPLWLVWLIALSVVVAMDAVALILGKPSTSLPVGLDRIEDVGWTTWMLAALLFVLVRPLVEELIFRGILYPVAARALNDNWLGVAVTAAFFMLFYLVQVFNTDLGWGVAYWGLIYPFVLGMTAGLARAHTKSTWGAVGTHAMFGLFVILSALVTVGD